MQTRDFLYIDDLINLLIKIISSKQSNKLIFNVGSGKPVILKYVIEYIRNKIKKEYLNMVNYLYAKMKFRNFIQIYL